LCACFACISYKLCVSCLDPSSSGPAAAALAAGPAQREPLADSASATSQGQPPAALAPDPSLRSRADDGARDEASPCAGPAAGGGVEQVREIVRTGMKGCPICVRRVCAGDPDPPARGPVRERQRAHRSRADVPATRICRPARGTNGRWERGRCRHRRARGVCRSETLEPGVGDSGAGQGHVRACVVGAYADEPLTSPEADPLKSLTDPDLSRCLPARVCAAAAAWPRTCGRLR
jgi:hypothetical protein